MLYNNAELIKAVIGFNSKTPVPALEMRVTFISDTDFIINTMMVSDEVKASSDFKSLVPALQSFVDGLSIGQQLDISQGFSDIYDNIRLVVGKMVDSFVLGTQSFFDKGFSAIVLNSITPHTGNFDASIRVTKGYSNNSVDLQYLNAGVWTDVHTWNNVADGTTSKTAVTNPKTGSTSFRILFKTFGTLAYISNTVVATLA